MLTKNPQPPTAPSSPPVYLRQTTHFQGIKQPEKVDFLLVELKRINRAICLFHSLLRLYPSNRQNQAFIAKVGQLLLLQAEILDKTKEEYQASIA